MLGRGAKLRLLAEVAGPVPADARAWSLRREDFSQLEAALPRVDGRRVLLVSGGEDAARVAAVGLAATAAARGVRAALLECDLARPRLAADIGLSRAPGVHEYLRWEARAEELPQPVVLAGSASGGGQLVCIVAGRPAADPDTLLGLQSFLQMTTKLSHAYELVVVIGPSIVTEPGSLTAVAARADAVLAALPASQLKGREGKPLRRAVRALPVPTLGAIAVGES